MSLTRGSTDLYTFQCYHRQTHLRQAVGGVPRSPPLRGTAQVLRIGREAEPDRREHPA